MRRTARQPHPTNSCGWGSSTSPCSSPYAPTSQTVSRAASLTRFIMKNCRQNSTRKLSCCGSPTFVHLRVVPLRNRPQGAQHHSPCDGVGAGPDQDAVLGRAGALPLSPRLLCGQGNQGPTRVAVLGVRGPDAGVRAVVIVPARLRPLTSCQTAAHAPPLGATNP